MNPLPHTNNELSSLSNELHDLIDSHQTTLTQEHASIADPSHPQSLLLRVLHQQFIEHVEQQLFHIRQYTTHQHLPFLSTNSLATLHPITLTPTTTPHPTQTP
jgi:hypothetical protein